MNQSVDTGVFRYQYSSTVYRIVLHMFNISKCCYKNINGPPSDQIRHIEYKCRYIIFLVPFVSYYIRFLSFFFQATYSIFQNLQILVLFILNFDKTSQFVWLVFNFYYFLIHIVYIRVKSLYQYISFVRKVKVMLFIRYILLVN